MLCQAIVSDGHWWGVIHTMPRAYVSVTTERPQLGTNIEVL